MKNLDLRNYILEVNDFPKKGIRFKDITPLLKDSEAFKTMVDLMVDFVKKSGATIIVAPEARGFLLASAVAYASNCGLVIIRKPDKLPREVYEESYELEYGNNRLQVHKNDINSSDKVLILDDVLATGGTIQAIINLVKKSNATIVGLLFLADLKFLHDDNLFNEYNKHALIEY